MVELSARTSGLPALIAVYRECKKLSYRVELPAESLQRALISTNDELRADIFSLICTGYSVFSTAHVFQRLHLCDVFNSLP